eukprot:GHVS01030022.1.p1 GENE.GHVS01030022.1~~GHVS01030022.1.p1  ORF type:complete len:499 (+),score=97.65 GHVS01030022.1:23-1498(+)
MEVPSTAHYVSFLSSQSSAAEDLLGAHEDAYPICEDASSSLPPVPCRKDDGLFGGVRRVLGGRAGRKETAKVAWTVLVALACLAAVLAVTLLLSNANVPTVRERGRVSHPLATEQEALAGGGAPWGGNRGGAEGGDFSVWGTTDLVAVVPGLRPPLIWRWQESDFEEEFSLFVKTFGKLYDTATRHLRYAIFKKNVYFLHSHNSQGKTYKVRMNQFGDLTYEEFKANYLGLKPKRHSLGVDLSLLEVVDADVPKNWDWKEKGCVSEVKDQKQCGSCWAFSTTGALEGANCAQGGKLLDLSEQQLVDCAQAEGNEGCDGGEMDSGFQYVIDNKGICAEQDYGYTAAVGKCKDSTCKPVLHIQGFKDVPVNNEAAMKAALTRYGPLSVGIEADQPGFQFYSHGVFSGDCGNSLDHGVLVVGYGTDQTGMDYWTIKNSWGGGVGRSWLHSSSTTQERWGGVWSYRDTFLPSGYHADEIGVPITCSVRVMYMQRT